MNPSLRAAFFTWSGTAAILTIASISRPAGTAFLVFVLPLVLLPYVVAFGSSKFPWRARAFAVVLFFHGLYLLLGHAGLAVMPWRLDGFLADVDGALFAGFPSLIADAVGRSGVEALSFFYILFVPYFYAAVALRLFGSGEKEGEEFIAGLSLLYGIGLFGHLLLPAEGPVTAQGAPLGGLLYDAASGAIRLAGGPHGAFPSLHAAASAYAAFDRRGRPGARFSAFMAVMVAVSAVGLRYHYAVDILVGWGLAWACRRAASAWLSLDQRGLSGARYLLIRLACAIVEWAGAGPRRRFEAALERPAQAQKRVLRELVRELSETGYGQGRRLWSGDGYRVFAAKLSPVTYDQLRTWIGREAAGEAGALAPGGAAYFEPTSGSTAAVKRIPYTDGLRRSFGAMFLLWLHDLVTRGPALESGRTFLAVSPSWGAARTEDGRRIGLTEDQEHLPWGLRLLLSPFLISCRDAALLREPAAFKRAVSIRLLAAEDLEIVSLWSPSYFLVLLEYCRAEAKFLLPALRVGSRRRAALRSALESGDWQAVWPNLKIISCWASSHAKEGADRLRRLFPKALVQGKGLLATEGPVSLPWLDAEGRCVPLLTEVFLEFQETGGRIRRLHELEEAGEYAVLLTQAGGLARYRTGDRVRAAGRLGRTPCLELIGRCDEVVDLAGEKLSEGFAASAVGRLSLGESRFQRLVPVQPRGEPGRYLLLVDRAAKAVEDLSRELDGLLKESVHYRRARLLGQLEAPEVRVDPEMSDRFHAFLAARGTRWGAVKNEVLLRDPEAGAKLAEELG